jgi:phage-related minor tail protein
VTVADRSFAVAFKILGDVADGQKKLEAFEATLVGVKNASGQIDGDSIGAMASAVDRVAAVSADAAAAQQQLASATATIQPEKAEALANADRAAASAATAAAAQQKTLTTAVESTDPDRIENLAQADRQVAQAANAGAAAQAKLAAATRSAAQGNAANAISLRQTQQAMRQLPAQITDVVTSLASGQAAWLVLIQQGGQIKDSFGGIGPAFKQVTSLVSPMRLAIGLAVAAVGALALAFVQAEQEASRLNLAIATTNNAAGATAGNIEALAKAASDSSGISERSARAIASAMVQSGRLGIDTIGNLTQSVETYAAVTGQSTDQAAAALAAMFVKPEEAARRLNEQFHFLSLEQLKYIDNLVEQGRVEEAQLRLSQQLSDHLGGKLQQNLGTLERAWNAVGRAASKTWEIMLDIGRDDTLEKQIAERAASVDRLRAALERLPSGTRNARTVAIQLSRAEAELATLQTDKATADQQAADSRQAAVLEASRERADKAWENRAKSLRSWRERLAEETEKIRREGETLGKTQAQIDAQIAAVTKQLTPKARSTTDKTENAFLSQRQTLTGQLADAEQRLQNIRAGTAASDNQAITRLEAWLATNRQALKLDTERVASLRAMAEQIDQTTRAIRDEQELMKARERVVEGMKAIDAQWLEDTGRTAEAVAKQIEDRYAKLRADLVATGNADGLARLDVVIETDKARAQLAQLQQNIEQVFANQARQEQSVDAQINAGLITQLAGRERLVQLHRETANAIAQYLPELERLSQLPGGLGDAASAQLETLRAQLITLRATANELQVALTNGVSDGLSDALEGLVKGTMDLGEAVRSFARSVADSLLDLANQQITDTAVSGIQGLFGAAGGGEAAGATQAAAITSAGATAAASMGTGITGAGATAATAMATGVTTASTTGAAAMASGITTAGAAAAAQMAAAISSANTASGVAALFADGGWTGPGSKYQPAGIVHADEFVTRQEIVRQAGAVQFLTDFNDRGMVAIEDWRGYADGGLVVPANTPSAAGAARAYKAQEPAGKTSGRTEFKQRLVNVLDPNLFQDYMTSASGEDVQFNFISRNAGRINQILRNS